MIHDTYVCASVSVVYLVVVVDRKTKNCKSLSVGASTGKKNVRNRGCDGFISFFQAKTCVQLSAARVLLL